MHHLITRVIQPRCWVDMGGKLYLQGDGVLAALRFLGLRWVRDRDQCGWEVDPETNERHYFFRGRVETARGEVVWEGFGARTYDAICKRLPDVIHAAEKNCAHHAGVSIFGVGSMDTATLKDRYGVTPSGVQFDAGSKGGKGARSQSGELVCPFGKAKGTPLSQMETKDLEWLRRYAADAVEAPDKAKYAESNRALLDGVCRILEDRSIDAQADGDREG